MTVAATMDANILRYQSTRALGEVSRYTSGLQVRLQSGERVYLALSALELALYFERDLALHYDLEGRLTKVARPNQYRRRGSSHRVLLTCKRAAEEGGGIERAILPPEDADALVKEAHEESVRVFEELDAKAIALEYAKPDRSTAVAAVFRTTCAKAGIDPDEYVFRPRGIDPAARYDVLLDSRKLGFVASGELLMREGVKIRLEQPQTSELVILQRIGKE